ncbi:MAG: hypothetical protein H7645_02120 [Candidatus Heimdallarchaeota archaeon]|nr:hypothetical protein [Candidatus Heimdallarchaeota archaeon]MCK4769114.1 hypothetical protein [Candidatus Heimdallarchaeota archaeon]
MENKVKSLLVILLLTASSFNLVIVTSTNYVFGGSSSSGDIPPPGGNGDDTGGGSSAGGLYLNYRIPLIFTEGPYGPTLISITTVQNNTYILFGFESILFPNGSTSLNVGETLILDPIIEINLKNGSLIQAFTPLQIDVYNRPSGSSNDVTFSYSVLVMSMWGKTHQAPFDNLSAIIVAGFNQTEIDIYTPGEEIQYLEINEVGNTTVVELKKGAIIETNGPVGVVFYSLSSEGAFAFTSIPEYLWGTEYFVHPTPSISGIPFLEEYTEIVLSTISYGENIHADTDFDNSFLMDLPDNGTVDLPTHLLVAEEDFNHIYSLYTEFSLNIMFNYTINGTQHKAAISYIASDKMKWAEVFLTTTDYQNEKLESVVYENNAHILPLLIYDLQMYVDLGNYTIKDKGEYFDYYANTSYGFLGNGSYFSYLTTSPPENGIWNSSVNILYPLNLYSYFDNTSTIFPSWYRFPNINVKEIIKSPKEPTELRRMQLDIIIQNNGSIPSAPFWVAVFVNDTIKIHKKLDGLDINETLPIVYEEFQGFGKKILNVSVFTDSLSQIFELYEFDNSYEYFVEIIRNWNIIYISVAIGVIIIGFAVYSITKRLIKQRKKRKTQFDVILSDVEV